jgi:hypothetical protein
MLLVRSKLNRESVHARILWIRHYDNLNDVSNAAECAQCFDHAYAEESLRIPEKRVFVLAPV